MRKTKIIVAILFVSMTALAFTFNGGEHKTLEIGDKAPLIDYEMTNTKKGESTLNQIKENNGTLVIFSCNTCPFVIAWEDRYPGIMDLAKKNNIGFALINSNEAKRGGDDSLEEMIAHAEEKNYSNIPYLIDKESKLANAFGAKSTPHVFLFDAKWDLVYEGAIDDNHKNRSDVAKDYLNNAIKNLAKGEKIDPNNTNALGCSIKRIRK
jgi:thioredoxin-related protein